MDFESFVTVGGKTFGLSDGGVYELTGDTDAGQPIKWFLQAPPVRMDSGKLMPYQAYVVGKVPNDSTLFIIRDDEERFDYGLTSTDGKFATSRRRLGLGLRTKHYAYGLYGKAATTAELSTVTINADESARNN
jgi:hypothetical protein